MVRVTVTTDPILDARLPAGARFYKCALQVNPHDYGGTFRGQKSDGDAISHAHAIVDKAVAVGIEVLAVTNHNSVTALADFVHLDPAGGGPLVELVRSDDVLCIDRGDCEAFFRGVGATVISVFVLYDLAGVLRQVVNGTWDLNGQEMFVPPSANPSLAP